MIADKGILAQITNREEYTYTKLTKKDLYDLADHFKKVQQPTQLNLIVSQFSHLCFSLTFKHKDYSYKYVYHKRIEVYEFRFYKKYKQNVKFREYYNEKYEKII